MKENREALRKYLGQQITVVTTYEKEIIYKKRNGRRIIRKLFVESYIETPKEEYMGHIHINKDDFVKRPTFKKDRKYRLTGTVSTYTRENGSESLGLTHVTVEKL